MPQLLVLAALGVGAYVGARWVLRQLAAGAPEVRTAAAQPARAHAPRDLGPLEWDAQTGVYRPRRDPR